ncbi:MAG: DUF5606 domain-containing protein [Flavobacterium sp.]
MSIEKILAISGKPGLYELKLQTRTGFLAESLTDGKKVSVGLRSNVSLLSEISVYTYDGETRLSEVFVNIAKKENDGPALSHKEDNKALIDYFRAVLPEFDEDRVYVSDIKKILNWYNMLQAKGFVSSAEESVVAEETAAPTEE